jgi:hypothetical protein
MIPLLSLLEAWKSVEIASRLVRFLAATVKGVLPAGRSREPSSIADVRDGFFSENLFYGDTVHLTGRLSQYCPVYFP